MKQLMYVGDTQEQVDKKSIKRVVVEKTKTGLKAYKYFDSIEDLEADKMPKEFVNWKFAEPVNN